MTAIFRHYVMLRRRAERYCDARHTLPRLMFDATRAPCLSAPLFHAIAAPCLMHLMLLRFRYATCRHDSRR